MHRAVSSPAEPARQPDLPGRGPVPEAAETPRERRKLATRRAIQVAALRLALERGLDNLTVQAISDEADIAPRTFFTYFSSKDQAIAVELPWKGELLRSFLLARPPEETPLRALREVFSQVGAQLTEHWEETKLWRELVRRYPELSRGAPGTEDDVVRSLVQAVADRIGTDPATDPYPAVLVRAAVAVGRVAVERWCVHADETDPPSLDPFLHEAFDILERGL